jgi:tRNA(Arg) A34 adenosine deaminase TadA
MTKDNYYLRQALVLASQSQERFKHGALVIKNGKTLGRGVNTRKNDPTIPGVPFAALSVHAEARALKQAGYPRRANVFVARIGATGPRPSQPCLSCAQLLEQLDCRVVHT